MEAEKELTKHPRHANAQRYIVRLLRRMWRSYYKGSEPANNNIRPDQLAIEYDNKVVLARAQSDYVV